MFSRICTWFLGRVCRNAHPCFQLPSLLGDYLRAEPSILTQSQELMNNNSYLVAQTQDVGPWLRATRMIHDSGQRPRVLLVSPVASLLTIVAARCTACIQPATPAHRIQPQQPQQQKHISTLFLTHCAFRVVVRVLLLLYSRLVGQHYCCQSAKGLQNTAHNELV